MSVTVTVREGTFVFSGSRPDGRARWNFLRTDKKGRVRPGHIPMRWQRILDAKKRREDAVNQ